MYDFKNIEAKWQSFWETKETFKVKEDAKFPKDKRCYVLDMFPYPSGNGLHVGHPEGYTATDIYCRFLRMNGFNVLHPMGFDAFGLPAENFAIKTGTHPAVTTKQNIDNFRRQIKALGFSYDWSREISTCDEDYYKWTQWIFLQLFKKGLAYEAETPINWCPSCLTGLANEEVKEGKCERCGTIAERRNIRQWILKITEYAERLLQDLDDLDWPESVKQMQRNWIGKSEGAKVNFLPVYNDENGNPTDKTFDEPLVVFTTRPDTLFGATYMVISPEHKMLNRLTAEAQKAGVEEYVRQAMQKSDLERTELSKEKTGIWTGSYAKNPVNGKIIPIWVSDYVLAGYGTGAIMAVPAHDDRDWDFAKKFDLPIIKVVASNAEVKEAGGIDKLTDDNLVAKECTVANGVTINSEQFSGLDTETTKKEIIRWLEKEKIGERCVNYKLRDWIFARQRYWGEPMPLVHCDNCGIVPLDESELPLRLPQVESYKPTGSGESPLAKIDSWLNCSCPKCGGNIIEKTTKRGKKFFGCGNYPKCNFATWDTPMKETCPDCGAFLLKKVGKDGK
ncbi:MAG: leucine--tRNA ligase, partial [Spirochaetaceae bacterium]|nr:leucine--tRNA ligase [Spirochaetaceae bacterium]